MLNTVISCIVSIVGWILILWFIIYMMLKPLRKLFYKGSPFSDRLETVVYFLVAVTMIWFCAHYPMITLVVGYIVTVVLGLELIIVLLNNKETKNDE